jgi:hypothetical protein
LSFQKHCYESAGLRIRKCFVCYINKDFVRNGEINPQEFFCVEDFTPAVKVIGRGIEARIERMLKIMSLKECPKMMIGEHCKAPYECPMENCWSFLPEGNVFDLHRGGKKSYELFENGIHEIADIPSKFKLSDKQEIQRMCHVEGKPHVKKAEIKEFLKKLEKPVCYMDFETFGTAIPFFDGTKPYQQVPFQFSLHIVGDKTEHFSFLAEGKGDPRQKFTAELKKALGSEGSIVVYNESFEKNILKQLAQALPENRGWIESANERIVDLLAPFREFHYHHPKQRGSASLKKVLPALTGKGYADLEIGNGDDASTSFMRITFGDIDKEEAKKVRENLEKYCALDTEGMIWIVEELERIVG